MFTPMPTTLVEKAMAAASISVRHLLLFGALLFARPAWAWSNEGHEIVAVIAADDLTPTARSHVAQILGVPDDTRSVEKAMGCGINSARH